MEACLSLNYSVWISTNKIEGLVTILGKSLPLLICQINGFYNLGTLNEMEFTNCKRRSLQKNDMKKGQQIIPTLLHEKQNPRSMGQWYQFCSLPGPNESHPHETDFSWEKFLVTHHAYIYSVRKKRNPISTIPNLRLSSAANILNRKSQNPSMGFIIKKEHLQENYKNWNSKQLYVFSAR